MTTHYIIENDIGKAPLGHVWTGRDRLSGTPVVVKKIPLSAIGGGRNGWARHVEEIKSLTRISHPQIAPVLEVGEEDDQLVMVSQRPPGQPLSSVIGRQGRIGVSDLSKWLLPVIEGLAVAHDSGVLHRQIHEDLIIVTDSGETILTGFGLTVDRRVKQESMPPDLLQTGTGTHLSDQFLVGAMLGRLVAFVEPIPGLDGIVKRATEADPSNRYLDLLEMMEALDTVFEAAVDPAKGVANSADIDLSKGQQLLAEETPVPESREEITPLAQDLHAKTMPKRKSVFLPASIAAAVIVVVGLGWVFFGANFWPDPVEVTRQDVPESDRGPMALIGELLSNGHLDEAAQQLEVILSEDRLSNPAPALDALGTIRLQQGLSDEASALFERALTIQAEEGLYYKLSLAQASAGREDQVMRTLDEGLRLFPESQRLKEARFHLGGI